MKYLEQALSQLSGDLNYDRIAEAKNLIRKAMKERSSLPTSPAPYSTEKIGNSLLVVKVGSADRPATQEDIDDIRKAFSEARKTSEDIIVTHHLVNVEVFNYS